MASPSTTVRYITNRSARSQIWQRSMSPWTTIDRSPSEIRKSWRESSCRAKGVSICAFVCYEAILPDVVRELAGPSRPDLLVNLTNDTWFGDSTEPWIHFALAKLRAVEHRRYLIRSTNSGVRRPCRTNPSTMKSSRNCVASFMIG